VEVVRDFLEQKGAVQVQDAAELEQVMGELLAEDLRRDQLGRNALRVVREKLGAIDRTTDLIVNHLASSGRYPASLP
jgi:3-deoxy-D-manno-octulosonic-acid transferase